MKHPHCSSYRGTNTNQTQHPQESARHLRGQTGKEPNNMEDGMEGLLGAQVKGNVGEGFLEELASE